MKTIILGLTIDQHELVEEIEFTYLVIRDLEDRLKELKVVDYHLYTIADFCNAINNDVADTEEFLFHPINITNL